MSERVRCIVSEDTDPDVPRLIAPNGERVPIRYITPPKKLFGSRHYLTRLPVTKDGNTTCTKCGAQHRAYRAGPGQHRLAACVLLVLDDDRDGSVPCLARSRSPLALPPGPRGARTNS